MNGFKHVCCPWVIECNLVVLLLCCSMVLPVRVGNRCLVYTGIYTGIDKLMLEMQIF